MSGTSEDATNAPVENRVFVLVLQHPRERRNTLSTAGMIPALLRRAKLAVGLSWPNLAQALGEDAEPAEWGVLYLGSARPAELMPAEPLLVLDRNGEAEAGQARARAGLTGIVLLDGTWQEAKALWWRNPWLTRLHRIVLNPPQVARYGRLRREPRAEALSTIEAAALALGRLETRPEIERVLFSGLTDLLKEAPPRRPRHGRVTR